MNLHCTSINKNSWLRNKCILCFLLHKCMFTLMSTNIIYVFTILRKRHSFVHFIGNN